MMGQAARMKRDGKALVQIVRKQKRCSGKYRFEFMKVTPGPEIKFYIM